MARFHCAHEGETYNRFQLYAKNNGYVRPSGLRQVPPTMPPAITIVTISQTKTTISPQQNVMVVALLDLFMQHYIGFFSI